MNDRDFILSVRNAVFHVQCSLGSDGSLYRDLEKIVEDCNDQLAEVREVGGIKFRIYPSYNGTGSVIVEAMIERPGLYFDDRSTTCSPRRVDDVVADLVERLVGV